jgi:hypothetical protein
MKKILLIFLLILLSNVSNSEEKVNLSCAFYEDFNWDTLKFKELKPEDKSLTIHPKTKEFIYGEVAGNYDLRDNKIYFILYAGDSFKSDYSLNRVTSVFKEDWFVKLPKSGKYKKSLTFKGKCRKVESLF